MPHFGQVPGLSLVTSGCMGQTYTTAASGAACGDGAEAPCWLWSTAGAVGSVFARVRTAGIGVGGFA